MGEISYPCKSCTSGYMLVSYCSEGRFVESCRTTCTKYEEWVNSLKGEEQSSEGSYLDVDPVVFTYNCPDCPIDRRRATLNVCEFCDRAKPVNHYPAQYISTPEFEMSDDACDCCPSNPKNGGSGICHCSLPSMFKFTS